MHLLQMTTTENKKRISSHSNKKSKDSILSEFIPFQKERDSMGRLLKHCSYSQTQPSTLNPQPISISRQLQAQKIKELQVQEKINRYFKQHNFNNICQPIKNKINKKSIINVLLDNPPLARKTVKVVTESSKQYQKNAQKQSSHFRLTQTNYSKIKSQNSRKTIHRMNSNILPRYNSQASPNKVNKHDNHSLQKSISGNSNTFHRVAASKKTENLQKYAELNRYHRMQQLQVKTNVNFEQGHTLFLQKMKKSKQLAHEVRLNLQRLDNYYY